ncbi:TetR/AcrR family transcriptional regulator [Fictibacillus iocasae]|uniref:TetR/AcrR family transcriptional regulator n=1 Tax=Fictibacillus iocasae TaxID=2715437 RepID=A0ABW2NTC1_9BACL
MSKKQVIIESALELFSKQGFEATSVQQITDHAGISKGAFYLSFKSKDELIVGLIDHFMMQFTSDIDWVVKNHQNNSTLLFQFYKTAFQSFQQHADFAKIFIKEQSQTLNQDLITKLRYYDKLINVITLEMLHRLYGDGIMTTKYDLITCIKGFFDVHSHLFIFFDLPLDLEKLAASLAEKTDLLARHSRESFMTEELFQSFSVEPMEEDVTKEQLIELLEQKAEEIAEPIVKESLELLKLQLIEPVYSPAIVKGLMGNLREHPHCKWVVYLLGRHVGV